MDDIEQTNSQELLEIFKEERAAFKEEFLKHHVFEQAQFYESLDTDDRKKLYELLTPEEMADVFEQLEKEDRIIETYLKEMDKHYVRDMLLYMPKDEVVDVLKRLEKEHARLLLRAMPHEQMSDIMELFQYADETAGALMTTEYIALSATQTVGEAMQVIRQQAHSAEMINYAYVVDINDHLVGIVSLRDLLASQETVFIPDIMVHRVIKANVNDSQETVTQLMRDYDLVALPIISDSDQLMGIVTVDDVIDVIDEEAASDYSNFAAVDTDDFQDGVGKALLQRLPWLLGLMMLSLLTAVFVYSQMIYSNQFIHFIPFIILITRTASNAATQSLAVTMRKVYDESDTFSLFHFIGEKLGVSVLLAGVTSVLICTVMLALYHPILAITVSVSIFIAMIVSDLLAMLLPSMLIQLKIDTSYASAPLIGTVVDFLSIGIYLIILTLLSSMLSAPLI